MLGVKIYPNNEKYEGAWENNQRKGEGVMTFTNGDKYKGEFFNDSITGKGNLSCIDGSIYTGDFKEGKKSGQGTNLISLKIIGVMIYPSKEKYEGFWENDQRNGKGITTLVNGDKMEANYLNDVISGKVTLTYTDGSSYSGEIKEGKKHGEGICTIYKIVGIRNYLNKDKYEGFWENDQRQGKGTLTFANGDKYEGQFQNDTISGKGMNYLLLPRYDHLYRRLCI